MLHKICHNIDISCTNIIVIDFRQPCFQSRSIQDWIKVVGIRVGH